MEDKFMCLSEVLDVSSKWKPNAGVKGALGWLLGECQMLSIYDVDEIKRAASSCSTNVKDCISEADT